MSHARSWSLAVAVTAAILAACGSSDDAGAGGTTTIAAVPTTVEVRTEILADIEGPPGAEGRTLSLARYTIAPGAKLVPHVHPGVQMAHVESGTLTYTVVSGTALVRRAGATEATDAVGPTTIELGVGDAVTEVDGMVHFGENRSDEPVILVSTLLTEDGHPLAEPVTTTTTPPG